MMYTPSILPLSYGAANEDSGL
eukprot:COSAG04_NODE_23367_length_339_cov_1.504167_1_plen_21_part_10